MLSDEVYKDLLYTGSHVSIAAMPGMQDRTIILDGVSKSYAMTGWRLGYGVFPQPLVDGVTKLAVNSVSCANAFSQMAMIAALEGPQDAVSAMREEFLKRRDVVVEGLRSIPASPARCPRAPSTHSPASAAPASPAASLRRRRSRRLASRCCPAVPSGEYGDGCVRLSYANSIENIRKAIDRLRDMVESL